MQLFKLLKNAGIALGANFLSLPIQAIGIIVLARSLGVELFGEYTFSVEFSIIFAYYAESGMNVLATRELAKHPEDADIYLGNLLAIRMVTTLFFYAVMMAIAEFSNLNPEIVKILWVVGAASFLQFLSVFITGVFRAYERQDFEGIPLLVQSVTFLGAVVIGVFALEQGNNLTYVVWSLFGSYALMLLVSWGLMTRYLVRPRWELDSSLIRLFIWEAIPIAIAFALAATYMRVGVLVLQSRSIPFEVGLFTAAFRLTNNLGVIPYILAGAWLPSLARTAFVKPPEFRLHGMRLYKMLFLIGTPITVGSIVLADPIIDLIYGSAYQQAVPAFCILMLSTFLFFMNFANKTLLESCNRQTQWTIALGIGLGIGLGLSFVLIPIGGALGASLAAFVSNLVVLVYTLWAVASLRVWQPILNPLGRITACSLVMGLVIYGLQSFSWILAGAIGVVVYGIGVLVIRIVNLDEVIRSVRVMRRKRSRKVK